MQETKTELYHDWLTFAKASIQTRIDHTSESTATVLKSIQDILQELDNKEGTEVLLELKVNESTSSEIIPLLKDVLEHLDSNDALTQLIFPLFSVLQFEDRTRQKLESILGMLTTWTEVSEQSITKEDLAQRLMKDVISMEQQDILHQYFPEYIQSSAEEAKNAKALDDDDFLDLF